MEKMGYTFPLNHLRLSTPGLSLHFPSDGELSRLASRAQGRVLAPEEKHFMGDWTQLSPGEFELGFLQYQWATRAKICPSSWSIQLGVVAESEGELLGMVGINGENFPTTRLVDTGSWLLPEARGRGLGKKSRACLLELAFSHLGASQARSAAVVDNGPSLGVSSSLGYSPDGTALAISFGERLEMQRLLLRAQDYKPQFPVEVEGVEYLLPLLGLLPTP